MDEVNNTTNVKRETYNGLKNISNAKLFPRFVAFIVDLAIMGFVFFGLLLFTQNVISVNSPYLKKAKEQFYQYNIDSGLFEFDSTGTIKEKTFNDYTGYENLLLSYYTDYLVNKCPEKYRVDYKKEGIDRSIYWYNVHVLGQPDDLKYYSDDKLDTLITTKGPDLFTYKLDGETKLYNELALPKCLNNDPDGEISNENQIKLTRYFYISDSDNTDKEMCCYALATQDLTSRKFVSAAYDEWYNHYYRYPILGCLSFTALIFFFIIPMIFKNGETLGKLIFHLGLVNKLGYKYNRIQLIPRFFAPAAIVIAAYIIFGVSLITLGIVTFLALASYGLTIFNKDHKAIHDFIAGTIVVDKVHSEVYQNATEEEKVKTEIEAVKPLLHDVEAQKDDSILYVNENFDKQVEENDNNEEG